MENLSKRALRIGIIAGSMCICTAAYAAIPVIDDQNILQQLKTYEETVKVVTNTKEQISLQLKELEKLPSHILNGYKQTLENGREKIASILKEEGTLLRADAAEQVDVTQYIQSHIPGIVGNDLPQTLQSARSARAVTLATLMNNNEQTLKSLQQLMKELDDVNDALEQAMEDSANATGAMQAQQAANQIAALQARAQQIRITIQGLQGQQQALKLQAEAQEKKNQLDMQEAQGKAEKEVIAEMQRNTIEYAPVSNPWKTYGNLKFF